MLGEKIRSFRKNKNITLQELSDNTGLSIGYISQIERNLVDPSLSSLRKISQYLDIPTYLLMEPDNTSHNLTTRSNEVIIMKQPNSTVEYQLLTPMPDDNFIPKSLVIRFSIDANSYDGEFPVIHESEEILIIEKGELVVHLPEESIKLSAGDTTIIKGNIPHSLENISSEKSYGLTIFTPAIWKLPFKK